MRAFLFLSGLGLAVVASTARAQSSDAEPKNTPKEEAAMRRQNEEFARKNPPDPNSYKQTKQYKAQSESEKKKTDAMVKKTQEGVKHLRGEQEKKATPKGSSCPTGKTCASSAR